MYRQSPGRNQRSKGIKVKNVLQVCLLLAVCFWLIYQVKHSHDKKKEFDESDGKSSDDLTRLGRKTRVGGALNKGENHDEQSDDDEINGEEVDEVKHEEDEVEDKKVDVKDDDDETDEHEEEKSDAEEEKEGGEKSDAEEEKEGGEKSDAEEEKEVGEEREDGEESETHDTDPEDGLVDKERRAEESDNDGDDSSTREEHYKADDASSAVTQNRHPENILEVESKESETKTGLLVNNSSPNNTVTQESNDHPMSNATIEDRGLPSGNLTENVLARGSYLLSIDLGHPNNSISDVESARLDSNTNSTVSEFPNSSNNSASDSIPVEAGNNTETLLENNNEIEGEKSDMSDGNLEATVNPEEVEQDGIDESDTSISLDEKKVRTDLETLPEIQTEGANNEEDASE